MVCSRRLCLLPPTTMMGATLPAVARWVKTTPRGVSWLGYFYAGNTTGAVFGCLAAGFYLLRVYNVKAATFLAVALNVVGAAGAFALARRRPHSLVRAGDEAPASAPAPSAAAAWVVYLVIGLSGVTALGAEVIWTRLFALLLGATTYTFSIILAVFLIGIGLGSSAASFVQHRSTHPLRALGVVQLLLVGAIAWAHWNVAAALPYWPVNPPAGHRSLVSVPDRSRPRAVGDLAGRLPLGRQLSAGARGGRLDERRRQPRRRPPLCRQHAWGRSSARWR